MRNFDYDVNDTIAAVSTPAGKGAIHIIRVSGAKTLQIIRKIFRPALKSLKFTTKPGLYLGYIQFKNQILDQVFITLKHKPRSYTGEDLVEIQCHGNPLITHSILNLLIDQGARSAYPGEFTLRAFLNKKIDLIKAEALNEIINSKNFYSLKISLNQYIGNTLNPITYLIDILKKIIINLEVLLDHPDDIKSTITTKQIKRKLFFILQQIQNLIGTSELRQIYDQGINIIITGSVNVGKSSLFNLMIKRDKSIISHIPGTTRDIIEEYIELNGYPIKLIDTAGIKKAANVIEVSALKKTMESLKNANIILIVFDNSKNLSVNDLKLITHIKKNNIIKIVIINKMDLKNKLSEKKIRKYFIKNKIVKISVSRETGIKDLEKAIVHAIHKIDYLGKNIILNLRQRQILHNAATALKAILKNSLTPVDILTEDIKKVLTLLCQLVGEYTTENMLEDIFSNFCVGK